MTIEQKDRPPEERFRNRHPLFFYGGLLTILSTFLVSMLALQVKRSLPERLSAELHAVGLPASQEELAKWDRPAPAEDGQEYLKAALLQVEALRAQPENKEYFEGFAPGSTRSENVLKHREAFEQFWKELRPVRDNLEKAARYPAITMPESSLFHTPPQLAVGYAYLACMAVLQEGRVVLPGEADRAMDRLRLILTIVRKTRIYDLDTAYGIFVSVAVNSARFTGDLLPERRFSPAQLRELADLLAGEDTIASLRRNYRRSIASEAAMYQDFFRELRTYGSLYEDTKSGPGIFNFLFNEIENAELVREHLAVLPLADGSYSALKPVADAIRPSYRNRTTPYALEYYYPARGCFVYLCDDCTPPHVLMSGNFFLYLAELRLSAIACELAARGLEGSALPTDLATFPPDPFTDKPFVLEKHDGALYLRSTGPDGVYFLAPATWRSDLKPGLNKALRNCDDLLFLIPAQALTPLNP